MSRSSEEVLLVVSHVRNKKSDGMLYMMGSRMAWMQESKNSFSISHHYADIKVQKVSADTKPKVQLQVVMHDASADTFHFTNPMGREAQVKDRESVKDLLQQLLPQFRVKMNNELEQKNRMLQEDPELFQLYKDLVVAGIVTADEFWANRVQKDGSVPKKMKQEVGISAAFLADIQPQTDGCNGLKYNLTADIIESIFRTYPAVKRKHAEYVPDKLTEAEFWTKFFQSHYFHRDRINLSSKDLFADCAKTDEQNIQEQISGSFDDPLVDLNYMTDVTLGEGYGADKNADKKSTNCANASLIRRFNQHSTMVLQAGLKSAASSSSSTGNASPAAVGESQTNGNSSSYHSSGQNSSSSSGSNSLRHQRPDSSTEPPTKKVKLREKLEYVDLGSDNGGAGPSHTPSSSSSSSSSSSVGPPLRLKRADRYLHGPTPATAAAYTTGEDMLHSYQALKHEIQHWQPTFSQVLPGSVAVSVLSELSPGGALMKGFSEQQLNQLVGADVEQEVRHTYSALQELLRHFWSCFPTTSTFLEEKVMRMRTNLERFHHAKLNPVKERLSQYHYNFNLAGHMEEMLGAAYAKFNTWQTRRMTRK